MKTRILLLILFSSFFYGSLFSQTTNFALRFNGDGKVDCGTISDLNNLDLYSVQCLVNPSEWVENAYVFKRGNGDEECSLRFGTSGQLIYKTRIYRSERFADRFVDATYHFGICQWNRCVD